MYLRLKETKTATRFHAPPANGVLTIFMYLRLKETKTHFVCILSRYPLLIFMYLRLKETKTSRRPGFVFNFQPDIYVSPFKGDENIIRATILFGIHIRIFMYLRLKESFNKAHLFTAV